MNNAPRHPIQPLVTDQHGTIRFKENAIVRYLLDNGVIDMNQLAVIDFSKADKEQFAQLIGYSLGGFGELSYVSDETYKLAAATVSKTEQEQAESELLPCPFCGSNEIEYDNCDHGGGQWYLCNGCGTTVKASYSDDLNEKWNRRANTTKSA